MWIGLNIYADTKHISLTIDKELTLGEIAFAYILVRVSVAFMICCLYILDVELLSVKCLHKMYFCV